MTGISLCMIVKNEEETLAACLESVAEAVDEIVIVDTGSTDGTKRIAERFTDRIIDFQWVDDFAAARNFAFSQATQSFILWLDADDVLLQPDKEKLIALKPTLDDSVDAVSMLYNVGFDGEGNVTFQYRRNRLVKRANGFQWHGVVHEYLDVGGRIVSSDIAVTHRKHKKSVPQEHGRNLRIYERLIREGKTLTPRDLFYYANELKDHRQFEKAILYYEEFLATGKGWLEDEIRTCQYLADCHAESGNKEQSVRSILRSFSYDRPRPEFCCLLGDHFMEKKHFAAAIYWFEHALEFEGRETPGFHHTSFTTWYPYLQLCYCYWCLGDFEKAKACNEKAAVYRPNHFSVGHNRKAFAEKGM